MYGVLVSTKQVQLVWTACLQRQPFVAARIDMSDELWIACGELGERDLSRTRKAHAFPDFIDAAWIASIAFEKIFAPHTQPACDPNIDGIFLCQCAGRVESGRRDFGTM